MAEIADQPPRRFERGARPDAAGLPGTGTALLVMFVVSLIWGGSLPATKVGLAEFTPFVLSWLRLSVSALLFLAVLLARRELSGLRGRDWLDLLALGFLGYSGTIGLQTLGTDGTTGASAAVLGSTGPLFIAVCAALLLHERPSARAVAGLLVALAGVALVLGLDPRDPALMQHERLAGNLLVLASAGCFGVFTVVGKGAMRRHSPLAVSGITCLGGALGLVLPAAWELTAGLPGPTVVGYGVLFYLGVVVTFAGMLAWFWALRAVPASRGGVFLFVQPVSGVALAALLLGDLPTGAFLLGSALVIGGLLLVTRE